MEKKVITIGREFGSGGRELGHRLADALKITYYDKELLSLAARKSGLSTEFLESYDEKSTNSLLYSLVMGQAGLMKNGSSLDQLASQAQREAVLHAVEEGPCILVGRCADFILRERPDTLRVFISADLPDRLARIARRDQVSEGEAMEKVRRMDKTRRAYYSCHADTEWGAAKNYDLCLNLSRIGLESAVELICGLYRGQWG